MELNGKKINFLGDSITEGHGTTSPANRFTEIIAREQGVVARNYGIGGTRIARQASPSIEPRWDLDFVGRAGDMDPDADAVVIFGGTNDFGHGDAPLGTMADRCETTFYGALHLLFGGIRSRYPAATIAVLTPLHRCNEDNPRGDGNKTQDVAPLKTYVEIIREVAEFYSLPVLDLYKNSGLQPRLPVIQQMYMPDGLHPNDAGHRVLADQIVQFLRTL